MVRPEILGEAEMHREGMVLHLPQGGADTRDPPAAGGGILWLAVMCLTPLEWSCLYGYSAPPDITIGTPTYTAIGDPFIL